MTCYGLIWLSGRVEHLMELVVLLLLLCDPGLSGVEATSSAESWVQAATPFPDA